MKQFKNLQIGLMGVVNATPDSFSDGGKFNSPESFKEQIEILKEADIIDIGAESTAPFNEPISSSDEIKRLEIVDFKLLERFSKVSIDSYHPETVEFFAKKFSGSGELIWNDVSGVFDTQTRELLKQYPKLSYVFSHTHVPEKSETSHHMNYVSEHLDVSRKFQAFFDNNDLPNKIYLDPCFGFSKTREQNHELIHELPELIRKFDNDFVIGISRKSFLRFSDLPKDDPRLILETELHQSVILSKLIEKLKDLKRTLYFRIHDQIVYNSLGRF